jgi:hypothetical protein
MGCRISPYPPLRFPRSHRVWARGYWIRLEQQFIRQSVCCNCHMMTDNFFVCGTDFATHRLLLDSIGRRQAILTLIKTDHNNGNANLQYRQQTIRSHWGRIVRALGSRHDRRSPDGIACGLARLSLRKKYKTKGPSKTAKNGHKAQTHCKICDGYGHFAKTCPKRDGKTSSAGLFNYRLFKATEAQFNRPGLATIWPGWPT